MSRQQWDLNQSQQTHAVIFSEPGCWNQSWGTLVILVCRKEIFHEEQGIFACKYLWRGLWGPSFPTGTKWRCVMADGWLCMPRSGNAIGHWSRCLEHSGLHLGSEGKDDCVSDGKQWLSTHFRAKCHGSSQPSSEGPWLALSPGTPVNGYFSWLQVFSIIATLLYMVHAVFSLIRCKASYRNREHSWKHRQWSLIRLSSSRTFEAVELLSIVEK